MLRLMKYEFIHSMRSFLLSFFIFWIVCLLLPMFTGELMSEIPVFSGLMVLGFTVLVMGIVLALFISIITRYYYSMFKRPAYLTLTLPVSSWQLIGSKLVVSYLWLMIGVFVLLLGIGLSAVVAALMSQDVSLSLLFQLIPDVINNVINKFFSEFSVFLKYFLYGTVEIYHLIIFIYFALTVVHTKYCCRYRLAVALVLWFIMQLFFPLIRNQFGTSYTVLIFYDLMISILLTVATVYIIDHHIEIE